jgi:hypothetical protein
MNDMIFFMHEIAEDDEHMVRCSNPQCHLSKWFHISCLGNPNTEGDVFCCADCKDFAKNLIPSEY